MYGGAELSIVNITINGKKLQAQAGKNLLEEALALGIDIPHLCYDPRIAPFGSCRLCFVEVVGRPNPIPSCSLQVTEGMEIITESESVRQLRKMALELIMAEHCGDCLAPCRKACPADVDIQGFVAHLNNQQYDLAADLIREKMPLPSICGRVCPRFCEKECRRNVVDEPVDICGLKRFAGDLWLGKSNQAPDPKPDSGHRVAVVGGGPAGLTAAYFLAMQGHQVSLYDAGPHLGGMLRYGIPEYRLPKSLLDQEIAVITNLCKEIHLGKVLGRDFSLTDLKESYDAVFLGVGCQEAQQLGLENEALTGVYTGIEFLRDVVEGNAPIIGNRVAVVGGGNTAMDAARTAIRQGAQEVMVIYRRSQAEMPAEPIEIQEAMEEGVQFHFLTNPQAFIGDGKIAEVQCVCMELGAPDASGRRRPVEVAGSEFLLPVDTVILAIGQKVEQELVESLELPTTNWGTVLESSVCGLPAHDGVFVAGDCISGAATVVEAVGAARMVAMEMNGYLQGQPFKEKQSFAISKGGLDAIDPKEFTDVPHAPRVHGSHLLIEERKLSFSEYSLGISADESGQEAIRCLECGCADVNQCTLRELATEYQVDGKCFGYSQKRHEVNDDHPHIVHDADKCILCGKCVQLCKEVAGVSALGFVHRGYDTVVAPALGLPLADVCTSCGDCVSACPTGALTQKVPWVRRGPWANERIVETTCLQCDLGCALHLHLVGDRIIKASSPLAHPVSQGSLCKKGMFDYDFVYDAKRIKTPQEKVSGEYQEVSWDKAFTTIVDRLQQVQAEYGSDSIAVFVSPRLTNEEQFLAKKLGQQALLTKQIVSTRTAHYRSGSLTYMDIETSDFVLVLSKQIMADYPVVAKRIRKSQASKDDVIIISNLATTTASETETIISRYMLARKPVIVVDSETLTEAQQVWIDRVLAAKGSTDQQRVMYLSMGGNTRGQRLMGIEPTFSNRLSTSIKAAIIIGDDLEHLPHGCTSDTFTIGITANGQTDLAFDVVLPAATFIESEGTVINAEGRIQHLKAANHSPSGFENWEIINELYQRLGVASNICTVTDIFAEMVTVTDWDTSADKIG